MKFGDLIRNNSWLSVQLVFPKLYPDQESFLPDFERVFNDLKTLKPVDSEISIIVSNEIDEHDNEEYINISGCDNTKTTQSNDELTDSLSLKFTTWNEWLGMGIDKDSLKSFSQFELICHCLHEMTFRGF